MYIMQAILTRMNWHLHVLGVDTGPLHVFKQCKWLCIRQKLNYASENVRKMKCLCADTVRHGKLACKTLCVSHANCVRLIKRASLTDFE